MQVRGTAKTNIRRPLRVTEQGLGGAIRLPAELECRTGALADQRGNFSRSGETQREFRWQLEHMPCKRISLAAWRRSRSVYRNCRRNT
jgi:hypothetical protein